MLPPTTIHSYLLALTPTHSHLFAAHCHLFPLVLVHSHSFSAHSYPLLLFSPFLLNLSPLPPMYSLSHSFPVRIQILSHNPTHYLSFQSIFSLCVLRAYVFYIPVRLCAFVFHVSMCLCNSFLCTLLPISKYFTCVLCLLIRQDYLFTLCFLKRYL